MPRVPPARGPLGAMAIRGSCKQRRARATCPRTLSDVSRAGSNDATAAPLQGVRQEIARRDLSRRFCGGPFRGWSPRVRGGSRGMAQRNGRGRKERKVEEEEETPGRGEGAGRKRRWKRRTGRERTTRWKGETGKRKQRSVRRGIFLWTVEQPPCDYPGRGGHI